MGLKLKLVPSKRDLSKFGKSIDITRRGSNIQKVALTPAAPLFAVGAGINKATGGKTTTYNVWKAASGKAPAPTYSKTTQAASGYQGAIPGQGKWNVPVANKTTIRVVGETVRDVADAATEGLGLPSVRTLLYMAGAGALGLGGLYVATMPKPSRR